MSPQQTIRFNINISYDQFLVVYQGVAKNISVIADDGRRILFLAKNIQPYLTRKGIQGYFEMTLSAENKFIEIHKLR
jgi:hypothetical protein